MILVTIKQDKNHQINEIFVTGHSNYAEAGKDIVCSAVSTAMFVSIGLIEKVCPKYNFSSEEKTATMKLEIYETNEFTNIILDNLVTALTSISEDYAKYLKIKFEK